MHKDIKKVFWLAVIGFTFAGIFFLTSTNLLDFKDGKTISQNTVNESIQELNQQIRENNKIDGENVNIAPIEYEDITIMIPQYMFNVGLEFVKEELLSLGLSVDYIFTHNDKLYTNHLEKEIWDIALLPYDKVDIVNYKSIDMQENIGPYFITMISDIIHNENKVDFVPYAIDPMVGFVQMNKNIPDLQLHNVLGYVLLRKSEKRFTMPIVRFNGDDTNNYENENIISSIVYTQVKESSNIQDLESFDAITKKLNQKPFTENSLENIVTILRKNRANCFLFPAICVLAYNFTDIKIGFLSDLDIMSTYFSDANTKSDDLQVKAGPIYQRNNNVYDGRGNYPVRVWGFVVNKKSEKTTEISKFLQSYIQIGQGDYDLNTLPVMNQARIEYDKSRYKKVLKYQDGFELIQ